MSKYCSENEGALGIDVLCFLFTTGQKRVLEWAIEHADQKSLALNEELNNAYS